MLKMFLLLLFMSLFSATISNTVSSGMLNLPYLLYSGYFMWLLAKKTSVKVVPSFSTLIFHDQKLYISVTHMHWISVVICSGTLLFISRPLRPRLVTLCLHKSGRCAVELYHAFHFWYPPFYTSPMASSALQHWTASPTKEGCHWQGGGENRQTWQLANLAWYP